MEDRNIEIGNNVKRLRKAKGFSQDTLAIQLGLSRTSVVNLEQGRHELTLTKLYTLCEIFHCQVTDLLPPPVVRTKDDIIELFEKLPQHSFPEVYSTLKRLVVDPHTGNVVTI